MFPKRFIFIVSFVLSLGVMVSAPGVMLAQDTPSFPVPAGRLVAGDDNGLFTMLADGSSKTYLVEEDDPNCWLRDGAWSPDGSQLIYTRVCGGVSPTDWHDQEGRGNRSASVFLYDMQSGDHQELVANDGTYQDYAGGWNPDGQTVVIASNRANGRYNLFTVEVESGETTQITDYEGDVARASWDPTGRYLLFNRYIVTSNVIRWEVRVLDTTNQNEIVIAPGLTPTWSPDGKWIAYTTEGEQADIFILSAECVFQNNGCNPDRDARNVTQTPNVTEREPLWSPDQSQIAYLRDTNPDPNVETWDIFRQELRTGLWQNLTQTPDIKERHSAWEPVPGVQPVAVDTVLPVVIRADSPTLNLRKLATTGSEIVGVINRGQPMIVQGATPERDWYYITLPEEGSSAWVFGEFTQKVVGDLASVPVIEQ